MAYFSSILTRYKENASDTSNQSYTASDDNINAQVVAHTTLAYESGTNDRQVNVTGLTTLDLSADLIAFDRVFKFTATDAKLTGVATSNTDTDNNDGFHGYFANCTFIFDAAITENSGQQRRAVLGSEAYDWRLLREVDIPTDRSGKSVWHFYNCKFIWNDAATTAIVHGDVYDCTQICANPGMGDTVLYPMGGAITENFYSDFSAYNNDAGTYQGYFAQYAKDQGEISGLSLQNQYLYPLLNGGTISFPLLSAQQTILYSSSSGGTPSNPPIIRVGEFSNTISAVILPSPKVDTRPNGAVWWRNARNLDDGDGQCRVISSRRLEPRFYSDVNQTENRADVKYTFTTDVEYTTAGNALTIGAADSNSTYTYESTSNGTLIGTFNFSNGAVSVANQDHLIIDVPVSYLEAEEGVADNDFSTVEIDMSTTLERVSMFGQLNDTITIDSSNWAADQAEADANDGFWIPHDADPIVDLDDEFLVNYDEISDIMDIADDGGTNGAATISMNDVYALYKYGVYNKDIGIADYPYGDVSNGTFDMSSNTVKDVIVSSSSSNNPIGVSSDELLIHCAGLESKSTDVITKVKADTFNLNSTGLQANIEGNITFMRQYDDGSDSFDASSTDTFSVKGCTIGGTVDVRTSIGSSHVAVFRDVEFESGTTVRRRVGDTNPATVYLTGTTTPDNVTFTDIEDVFSVAVVTVNLATAVSSINDVDAVFFESADGTTFTAATATASINDDLDVVTYVVLYDPTVSGNQVYFSVVADQNTFVRGTITGDTTVSTEAISTTNANDGFTAEDGTDDETALNASTNTITVGAPTSATGNFNVTFGYNSGSLDVTAPAARKLIRNVQRTTAWREAVAKGFIPVDFIEYTGDGLVLLSKTEADRITFRRASHDARWNFQVRAFIRDPYSDQYDQLSTTASSTYIQFLVGTDGASITEIAVELTALREAIKGTDDKSITEAIDDLQGEDGRTLEDIYDKVEEVQNDTALIPATV